VADRFEDHRGVIQDLPLNPLLKLFSSVPIDAVTHISTVKGGVRGNHVHHRTTQWTYILSGRMLVAGNHVTANGGALEFGPGAMIAEPAGIPHAWQALEDTTVLVFTRGPRSGEAYESDTERLEVPLIEPAV